MAPDESLPNRGSRLCTECGLCCDGALHDAAVLLPEEVPLALRLGMKVDEAGSEATFQLPCHLLKDRCCTVYADRPSPCRIYRCKLLRELEAGEVELDEGLSRVRTARSLFDRVTAHLLQGMTISAARNATIFRATENLQGVPERERSKVRLHVFALSYYLDRYFRTATEGAFLASTRVAKDD